MHTTHTYRRVFVFQNTYLSSLAMVSREKGLCSLQNVFSKPGELNSTYEAYSLDSVGLFIRNLVVTYPVFEFCTDQVLY